MLKYSKFIIRKWGKNTEFLILLLTTQQNDTNKKSNDVTIDTISYYVDYV